MTPTNEEIIKGNRVIAEGTGWEYVNDAPRDFPNGYYFHTEHSFQTLEDFIYHESWEALMPVIERIRDQMGLHTLWQAMKALQENYAKVGPEDFQTITDVWKAVVIYFERKK